MRRGGGGGLVVRTADLGQIAPPNNVRRPAPSNTTAHHSSLQQHTRRPHARERRGPHAGPTRRPRKVVLVPWPVVSQTKHTDRQKPRRNARLNEERGWKTRGGNSKTKEQSSGDGGARSVVGPDWSGPLSDCPHVPHLTRSLDL